MSAAAPTTVAAFADAHSAHAAAVAALNGGTAGTGTAGGSGGGIGSNSPSIVPSSSPLASMGMPSSASAGHGGAVPDKFQAAAAAAASNRKGRGRPRSGTISLGAEMEDPDVEADADHSADADSADGVGALRGQKLRKRMSTLEKKDQRANMFENIHRVMDLTGQEEWLNDQGRRTLRDPLDDEALSPSSAVFRGCMEVYQVRHWRDDSLDRPLLVCTYILLSYFFVC